MQIACPPGGAFSHPPAGRPPAAGRRSGGTGSPRRALSPGAAPGPPCGVWQAFLSQKILSVPGSSFPQLFYGMKESFAQARGVVLNRSGKKRYDSIKYDDKGCSLVTLLPQRGFENTRLYEYDEIQRE